MWWWWGPQEGGEQGSTRFCLVTCEWELRVRRGHSKKSATELGVRLGDWTWRRGGGEDLQLAYLRSCPESQTVTFHSL